MPKSILSDKHEYDVDNWIVSIFNSGDLLMPHAILLVEGQKKSYNPKLNPSILYFVGQYDIFAITTDTDDPEMSRICGISSESLLPVKQSLKNIFSNQMGVIASVKVY